MVLARGGDEGVGVIGEDEWLGAAAPDLGMDRGRGLFLVRAYVDELQVSGSRGVGTEVRFSKKVRLGVEGGTE